jgi:heme exporter protein A
MSVDAIQTTGLTRYFGPAIALDDVDLRVREGTALGLLGPNGAGKSTLLGLLSTLLRPTSGTAVVAGHDVASDGAGVRANIGVVTHAPWFYDGLTVRENLAFFGRLFGVRDASDRIVNLLSRLGLTDIADRLPTTLSRGMRKRLTIARALIHDPSVLLFDEPFAGLDRRFVSAVVAFLRELRDEGRTVLVVTHDISHAWAVVDRAVILNRGRIVEDVEVSDDTRAGFERTLDHHLQMPGAP